MSSSATTTLEAARQPKVGRRFERTKPRVLLVGPSLRIMGGQAVMADRLVRAMKDDGVDIEFLPINPVALGMLRRTQGVKGVRTLVTSSFYVTSLLRAVPHFDVIHLFSASYLSFIISQLPAILVARFFRKPLILNYRSGQADEHLRKWGRSIYWILRLASRIVVPSRYLVDVFAKYGFDATHVHNVVDPRAITYRLRRRAEPRIIVPRALEPLYNVGCALRAFAIVQQRHHSARLTILGDGSQREELESLARALQLRNVVFAGRVEREAIGVFFDDHDVMLNTSSIDNMPVSLLEGFAAGLPIVSTNAGGIPYFIRDRENAHLVNVNDHEEAARRVLELLDSPAEVERLSRLGRSESMKYSWDHVSQAWYRLYDQVWQDHCQPAPRT